MLFALILIPLAFAGLAFALPSQRWRPWLLPLGGVAHLGLYLAALREPNLSAFDGWLVLDPLGRLVLGLISVLFLLSSLYAPAWLALRPGRSNRVFCANLLVFLSMMTLITVAHHLGLMWVAIEATTLAIAPLIYYNRSARSLEATWKYLLIGSVGIALSLLGSFFLAYSALGSGLESTLLFEDLIHDAPQLSRPWLHAAFVLLFVGYGTKMGIAPMHTWKPDAYGEAPGLIGTLLAGGLTSGAFLAILRFFQICTAAGEAAFARPMMIGLGLISMVVAGVFMARQRDFKRLLAYSSVEHMGILVLGVGVGGTAVFGALLHLLNNGLTKGALFLSAANIHRAYGSKLTAEVTGALQKVPISAALFLMGFFAITGSPPFGPFMSEFTIVRAAIYSGQYAVAGLFLLALVVVFIGMGATVLPLVQGEAAPSRPGALLTRETFFNVAPPIAFMGLVLLLGVYIPSSVGSLLKDAVTAVELGR
jgi:hydrogenase-4 component F